VTSSVAVFEAAMRVKINIR